MTHTIELLNSQMNDEVWKADHIRAMQCGKLEDTIARGLSLYQFFSSTDELWSRRVQEGTEKFDADFVRALHKVYSWWLKPLPRVMKEAEQFISEGYPVKGASELLDASGIVRQLLKIDVEEIIKGMTRARAA